MDSCSSTHGTLVDKKLERRGIVFGTVDSFKNFIVRHTDNWFWGAGSGGRVETAPEQLGFGACANLSPANLRDTHLTHLTKYP